MKKFWKPRYFPLVMLAGGALGILLRLWVCELAVDQMGLLVPGHPLRIALWLLAAGAVAFAWTAAAKLGRRGDYAVNFPSSLPGAAGSFVLATCILLTVLAEEPEMAGAMGKIWMVLGIGAAVGLAWAGICRLGDKPPIFVSHLMVCLFLAIHIVTHYQTWSSTPAFLDYAFSLLGAMFLMFFAYYHTGFDVGLPRRRKLMAVGLTALFFGTVALAESRFWLLYAGGLFWVLTNFCVFELPQENQP